MTKKAVFVAATRQHVGKSTVCLGILSGLQRHFKRIGFIKPVGQRHVIVNGKYAVDKDVVLLKERFQLTSDYVDMSPVIIPPGFTKDYLDGKVSPKKLAAKIEKSFDEISSQNDYTVVEGTGHVGVGNIIGFNNAQIAAMLGLDIVIVCSGGLGSSFDELSLNFAMCEKYGVKVRGIIVNKIIKEKMEMIQDYFPKTLREWNVPMLGSIPYNNFLDNPCMKDFEGLFKTKLLSGEKHTYRHFSHTILVAGSLESYQEDLKPNQLIITPSNREDIIMATLERHLRMSAIHNIDYEGGIILTGRRPPRDIIVDHIKQIDIPVLYVPILSYDAMTMIASFTAKIQKGDISKVEKAIQVVEENIDFNRFTMI